MARAHFEIKKMLNKLENDSRVKDQETATIAVNAPLALTQLSIESKIAALKWTLGETEHLIVG